MTLDLDASAVLYAVEDGVCTITMNRAAKRNAVNVDLAVGVREAMLRAAAGVGLAYACFADIRFAAEDAIFTTAYVRRGVTGEFGMAWILTRLVGHGHAADLLLSGRRFDAPEAKAMGLVNRVYPRETLAEATYAYAKDMARNCSPMAMKTSKQELREAPHQSVEDVIRLFKANNQGCIATGDPVEGAASFLEKRLPNFKPL